MATVQCPWIAITQSRQVQRLVRIAGGLIRVQEPNQENLYIPHSSAFVIRNWQPIGRATTFKQR
jgi:hypothetical protein